MKKNYHLTVLLTVLLALLPNVVHATNYIKDVYVYVTSTKLSNTTFSAPDGNSYRAVEVTGTGMPQDFCSGLGEGSDFVYVGYTFTTDPTQAITDIRFYVGSATMSGTSTTIGGCTYYRASTNAFNAGNLNSTDGGTSHRGNNVFLLYTRANNTQDNVSSLTGLKTSSSTSLADHTILKTTDGSTANLNSGTGSTTPNIYMFKQTQNVTYIHPSFSMTEIAASTEKTPTLPTLNKDGYTATVTYTSSKSSVVSVKYSTGALTILGTGSVTITADFPAADGHFAASASYVVHAIKTSEGMFTITSSSDWLVFANFVDISNDDVNATMWNSITYPGKQIGGKKPFKGTFVGLCHTINGCTKAPFGTLMGATIMSLKVQGDMTVTDSFKGGIADLVKTSPCTFDMCTSEVNITCNQNGAAYIGGLVGRADGQVIIENCLFSGSIQNGSGYAANACAGFIGYNNSSSSSITNCLTLGTYTVSATSSKTMALGTVPTITNSYYLNAFGTAQGTQTSSSSLTSGSLTWTLQGDQSVLRWTQNLGQQSFPQADSDRDNRVWQLTLDRGDAVLVGYGNKGKVRVLPDVSPYYENTRIYQGWDYAGSAYGDDVFVYDTKDETITRTYIDMAQNTVTKDSKLWYLIDTDEKLAWYSYYVNKVSATANAKLTANIDLSSICHAASGSSSAVNWTPIGSSGHEFTGSFDGDGYTVSKLYINQPSTDMQALFGRVGEKALIKNVKVSGEVTGQYQVAGIVARANSGTSIKNCSSSVVVKGQYYVGGICGLSYFATISDCYNSGTVEGRYFVGGITSSSYDDITNCLNRGAVTGTNDYVGGISGSVTSGNLISVANEGNVTSPTTNVGAIAGSCKGTILNSFYLKSSSVNTQLMGVPQQADNEENFMAKDAQAFQSGEVAWLLDRPNLMGQHWYQYVKIGDKLAVGALNYAKVYRITLVCGDVTQYLYGNELQSLDLPTQVQTAQGLVNVQQWEAAGVAVSNPYEQGDADITLTAKLATPSLLKGDANGDGSVTITDALAIVYHVLNKTVDNFNAAAADMDDSGDISITDALAVVKMVLGGNASAKEIQEIEELMEAE